MSWRLAKSLATLRTQVNETYPKRSRASDGTIGDAAHAATASDHNPNAKGVVCALDLTHDPKNLDAHKLADRLRQHRHPNLKYIISNGRITGAWSGWRWEPYRGINPHSSHIHISVGVGADGRSAPPYDSTIKWNITEDDMLTKEMLVDIFRHQIGKDPRPDQIEKYVGKYTYHDFRKGIRSWPSFQNDIERAKNGTLNPVDHLPGALRSVYKAPDTGTPSGGKPVAEKPDYSEENNALLKQILAIVQSILNRLKEIFK